MPDDSDQKRINLLVSEERKQEWQNAVESSTDYNSLSHLIRTAVERELSGVDTGTGSPAPMPRDGDIGELTTTVESLEKSVDGLATDLERLRDDIDTSDSLELEPVLLEVLPDEDGLLEGEKGVSAKELASRIQADPEEVAQTMAELYRDVPAVKVAEQYNPHVEGDDDTYTVYYRDSSITDRGR
jgi:hypothetical protein